MSKHIDRKAMIKAVRDGRKPKHLEECSDCRADYILLKEFFMVGKRALDIPPAGWIDKAAAIMEGKGALSGIIGKIAELVFDSWTSPQPAGVRGIGLRDERRMRFELTPFAFDLRAEKSKDKWSFVGQVLKEGSPVDGAEILIGKTSRTSDSSGFIQWSSKTPPSKIRLIIEEFAVDTPDLTWKKRSAH